MLEGIRGALIQTRAVKSVRGPPSRTYYLGTSIGSFVHAADELHHAAPREKAMRMSLLFEERSTVLMGTQLRVKNPCILASTYSESNYTGSSQSFDCCSNTLCDFASAKDFYRIFFFSIW